MSVRVMTAVFDRYPVGGGEFALALALADIAHDDGSNIYPSVGLMSRKSRQSERTVQYLLRRMVSRGWLEVVAPSTNGRGVGMTRGTEYRITRGWMQGGELIPVGPVPAAEVEPDPAERGADSAPLLSEERGATDGVKGCNSAHKGVQSDAERGAKLLHPNQKLTITKATESPPRAEARTPTREAASGGSRCELVELPTDWQPGDEEREVLKARGRVMPDQHVIDAFVAHYLGRTVERRLIANLFLKWVSREQGFAKRHDTRLAARTAEQTASTSGDQQQLAAAALRAWDEVSEATAVGGRSGHWRKDWSDARTAAVFAAFGGYGALADLGPSTRRALQERFLKAFIEKAVSAAPAATASPSARPQGSVRAPQQLANVLREMGRAV